MRLISFPIGLECSQWSPDFPPQLPLSGWEVFHQVPTLTIPRSTELASEEGGNCNNVSGEFLKRKSRAEKSRSGSHVTTNLGLHPGRFDLLRNASPSRAPTWSRGTFSPTHSSPYALVSLSTRLSTHSSYNYIRVPAGRTFCRYLSEIVHLSRCHPRLLQYATRKLSCQLNAIDAPPLCGSQSRH